MQVTIIGAGYVGLTTGLALAYLGHKINLIDHNPQIIKNLQNRKVTIYEFGLEELIRSEIDKISFTSSYSAVKDSEVVIIAVGTPLKKNGDVNLDFIEKAAEEVGNYLNGIRMPLIFNKSTSPPGTTNRIRAIINGCLSSKGLLPDIIVASNPEFLREGNALFDTFFPDSIVFGAKEKTAFRSFQSVYRPIIEQDFAAPSILSRPKGYKGPALLLTDPVSAELTKYAANAFLSIKISFINEFAGLAELLGADIQDVSRGIGLDKRIGEMAGIGWGGSYLGKDAMAIKSFAGKYGHDLPLLKAAMEVNQEQRKSIIKKLQSSLKIISGSNIGILGLSFKPGTDDVRDTPATYIIQGLLLMGAQVKVYDPFAMKKYKKQYPSMKIKYTSSLEELAVNCDAIVLLTKWEQFKKAPWDTIARVMRKRILIDGRNFLDPEVMSELGFIYQGIGRYSK